MYVFGSHLRACVVRIACVCGAHCVRVCEHVVAWVYKWDLCVANRGEREEKLNGTVGMFNKLLHNNFWNSDHVGMSFL